MKPHTTTAPHDDRARTLIEAVMRNGDSIAAEYPTLFGPLPTGELVTLEHEGDLRAACAIQARDLVAGPARVRVGLIGSVVTDPAYHNQGFGTRLLEKAQEALRDLGCSFALLWADERGFYARRGWTEISCERDFIVTPDLALDLPESTGCRPLEEGDVERVHALYRTHERRAERTPEETRALLGCPAMSVLVHETDGVVDAYACLGRGRDLPNVIHEWGGAADGVLRLVRAHVERRTAARVEDELYVMAPGVHGEVQGRLALAGVPSAYGVLGMGKVLDAGLLAGIVANLLGEPGTVRSRVTGPAGDEVEFRGPRGVALVSTADLIAIALAPRGERGAARELAARVGGDASSLPLNPFVWGLDSI
ncbi:MAG: GNAT family N-acetyltransferase [Planctomycetes bacterium]|nr:GNAT family N-acetyltransferase [Planctomycetota bacterium]